MTAITPQRDVLTQAEAEARGARVSNCRYELTLDITRGAEGYRGEAAIDFDVTGGGDLFLEYRGKTIERLEVNGREVAPRVAESRLTLPGAVLTPHTQLRVVYANDYDHTGDGFHQFVDPQDGEEYLYSNFEPYEAHRLFPCFDQPDIKATYRLTVTAPSEWVVIGNAPKASVMDAAGGRSRHEFVETLRFSTYLFALIAGPYAETIEQHRGMALGLYCRKSMLPHLDTPELFEITRQGLDFYAEFFDLAYPFGKYDQVFVPEFNAGAMENVGCVTHNEFMVFRDPPTDSQRRRRAEVILHEMAHMWFGDLVTMRWWNDLWLNESFATYMAYLSMTSATRFTTGWQDFNASIKNWAYRQDQLVTTHPISGVVADTDQTFLNFDGITYGKGASVLKQLVAAIGLEGFREGMRLYFRRHAYGNATLAQFMAALEDGSGKELTEWAHLWLETPSLNTLAARWEADGDRLTSLSLTQTAPADYPTIRPHTLEVGLAHERDGRIEVASLPATVTGAETEIAGAMGMERPALVFPNYNDHAYAKVALDAESVAFARENIQRFQDPLLRQLLWSSLWNMVRDQQLKSTDFLALVRERAAEEPQPELLEPILSYASTALTRFVPEAWRDREAHLLFVAAWAGLRAATKPDARITWMRTLIGCGVEKDDLALLGRLADGDERVEGLEVDQEMRWSIATRFVGFAMPGAAERVAAEAERDPSDRGQRARLRCETSVPEASAKAAAWERFHGDGYGSLHLTVAAMGGFNWPRQRALLEPYVEQFFARVPAVFAERDIQFSTDYFVNLFPAYRVEAALLERSEQLLQSLSADHVLLARRLREANDELSRAIKCRRYAEQ
jgi:aminopeptidase N